MVRGIVRLRLDAHEVDDATQEVFLLAWQRLDQLESDDRFGAWVAGIARNHAIDRLRGRRRGRVAERTLGAWSGAASWFGVGAARAADAGPDAHRVLAAVRRLPEAYQETLTLRLVEDLSGPEIAELTGLSDGSVRVNLHRGMELLRAELDAQAARRRAARYALAGAAVLAVALLAWPRNDVPWRVVDDAGECVGDCRFDPGDVLAADTPTWAGLDKLGRAQLDPGARLTREPAPEGRIVVRLDTGRMDVAIDAAPRVLTLKTPAADVVDLGCAYVVEVRSDQSTAVVVRSGIVALETAARQVRVPAGAGAVARLGPGPGTPAWLDAEPAFAAALDARDLGGALGPVLAAARPKDTLSLWNLLGAATPDERAELHARILALRPDATLADPAAVRAGDPVALEDLWIDLASRW